MARTDAESRLEAERWRNLYLQQQRQEAATAAMHDRLDGMAADNRNFAATIDRLTAQLAADKAERAAHPIRQLWAAYLAIPWQVQIAIIVVPLILGCVWTSPALALDILQTARICTTGQKDPAHGPP